MLASCHGALPRSFGRELRNSVVGRDVAIRPRPATFMSQSQTSILQSEAVEPVYVGDLRKPRCKGSTNASSCPTSKMNGAWYCTPVHPCFAFASNHVKVDSRQTPTAPRVILGLQIFLKSSVEDHICLRLFLRMVLSPDSCAHDFHANESVCLNRAARRHQRNSTTDVSHFTLSIHTVTILRSTKRHTTSPVLELQRANNDTACDAATVDDNMA